MRYAKTLISVASTVLLTACASKPYTVPTATIQQERPLECRVPCLMPPSLEMPREQWEAAVFIWGADCASWHRSCVEASSVEP